MAGIPYGTDGITGNILGLLFCTSNIFNGEGLKYLPEGTRPVRNSIAEEQPAK